MDIGGWLRSLGLERYEAAFRENAVGADVLDDLTDQDLEKLGVLLGDRRRLLRAIAALDGASAAASSLAPVLSPVTSALISAVAAFPTSSTAEVSGEPPGPLIIEERGNPELKSVPRALRANGIVPARGNGHSMTYHQLITRAVDELDRNTAKLVGRFTSERVTPYSRNWAPTNPCCLGGRH